jgi:hypothetical protein
MTLCAVKTPCLPQNQWSKAESKKDVIIKIILTMIHLLLGTNLKVALNLIVVLAMIEHQQC